MEDPLAMGQETSLEPGRLHNKVVVDAGGIGEEADGGDARGSATSNVQVNVRSAKVSGEQGSGFHAGEESHAGADWQLRARGEQGTCRGRRQEGACVSEHASRETPVMTGP